jgi:hypothetical protein
MKSLATGGNVTGRFRAACNAGAFSRDCRDECFAVPNCEPVGLDDLQRNVVLPAEFDMAIAGGIAAGTYVHAPVTERLRGAGG